MSTIISVLYKDRDIIINCVCIGDRRLYCFGDYSVCRTKAATVGGVLRELVSVWYLLFISFMSSLICLIPHHPHSYLVCTVCTCCYSNFCFCHTSALWNPSMNEKVGWKFSLVKETLSEKVSRFFSIKERRRRGWDRPSEVRAEKLKQNCEQSERREDSWKMLHLFTVWSTALCLPLLPGSPSRCALNAGENLRWRRIEIQVLTLPYTGRPNMKLMGGQLEVLFRFFHFKKLTLPQLVRLLLWWDTAAILFHQRLQHLSIFDCFSTLSSFNCLFPSQDNYLMISLPVQTSRTRSIMCVSMLVMCASVCMGVKVGVQGAERSQLWRKQLSSLAEGACLMSPRECKLTDLHLQTCECTVLLE